MADITGCAKIHSDPLSAHAVVCSIFPYCICTAVHCRRCALGCIVGSGDCFVQREIGIGLCILSEFQVSVQGISLACHCREGYVFIPAADITDIS